MDYDSSSSDIKIQFLQYMKTMDNAEMSAQDVYEGLIDEILLGLIFDIHYAAKCNVIDIKEEDDLDEDQNLEEDNYSVDKVECGEEIFGHKSERSEMGICPGCDRNLGIYRLTGHYIKCFKKNKSRTGSRNANSTKEPSIYCETSDDETDKYFSSERKKKDSNSAKKSKKQKIRNQVSVDNDVANGMSYEDKLVLFTQSCGVISEHTGKFCKRSIRCPQHSDEQRQSVRALALQMENGLVDDTSEINSNASSPTDSSSSSSSKKRQKNI